MNAVSMISRQMGLRGWELGRKQWRQKIGTRAWAEGRGLDNEAAGSRQQAGFYALTMLAALCPQRCVIRPPIGQHWSRTMGTTKKNRDVLDKAIQIRPRCAGCQTREAAQDGCGKYTPCTSENTPVGTGSLRCPAAATPALSSTAYPPALCAIHPKWLTRFQSSKCVYHAPTVDALAMVIPGSLPAGEGRRRVA